jgi:hypothetical protein
MHPRDGRFCERTAQRHRRSLTSEVCRMGYRRPPIGHSLSLMPYGRGSSYIRNAPHPSHAVSLLV